MLTSLVFGWPTRASSICTRAHAHAQATRTNARPHAPLTTASSIRRCYIPDVCLTPHRPPARDYGLKLGDPGEAPILRHATSFELQLTRPPTSRPCRRFSRRSREITAANTSRRLATQPQPHHPAAASPPRPGPAAVPRLPPPSRRLATQPSPRHSVAAPPLSRRPATQSPPHHLATASPTIRLLHALAT